MATVVIQKRKPKNPKGKMAYRIYYKDPYTFRSKHYKTFHKYKDAQRAAHHLRDLIDNGQFTEIKRRKFKVQPMKFTEVADQKKRDWQYRLNRQEISQTTFNEYLQRIAVLKRKFGNKLMIEFSKVLIISYHQALYEEFSPASANRYLFILKQIFNKGLEIGAVVIDPTRYIGYFSEKVHERKRFLLPDELNGLIAASKLTRAKFYLPALILLGAEHGTSKQEALSLKWSDIKFEAEDEGLINLFRTKNGQERTEFLMPRTKKSLLDWKAHLKHARYRKKISIKENLFVFCRLDGKPITRFDKAWNRTCEIAGIEDFHYHDLRHTFCSNLIMAGSDLKETRDMIGHKDIASTNRYSHLSTLHKKSLQKRLANRYNITD